MIPHSTRAVLLLLLAVASLVGSSAKIVAVQHNDHKTTTLSSSLSSSILEDQDDYLDPHLKAGEHVESDKHDQNILEGTGESRELRKKKKPIVKFRSMAPSNNEVVGPKVWFAGKIIVKRTKLKFVWIEVKAEGESSWTRIRAKNLPNGYYGAYLTGFEDGIKYVWRFKTKDKAKKIRMSSTTLPFTVKNVVHGLQPDCEIDDNSRYDICLDLKSDNGEYKNWMQTFGDAKKRWEGIIVDEDMPALDVSPWQRPEWIATALPSKVDDLYIAGVVEFIDGPGRILGSAGPRLIRHNGDGVYRTVTGYMRFDSADVAALMGEGTWEQVILHEIGHVLGISSALWARNGLTSGSVKDDKYHGQYAQTEWARIGCTGQLPVETDYGAGTAGGHWDERCLDTELMTGFKEDGRAYLSRITVGSLKDLGYGVDFEKADPFSRQNLGTCGAYCPHDRNLRRVSEARPTKIPISGIGEMELQAEAFKVLKQARLDTPASESLPDGVEYVGGEEVTVYIRDIDGHVKERTVPWTEVGSMDGEGIEV